MVENTLLERLDEMTFSGSQVQAAIGASPATLTRYYTAYGLATFTPNSSQGKRRDFVLADVAQLALAVELARTTDRPKMVASVLNQVAGFQGALRTRPGDANDDNTAAIVLNNEENSRLRAAAVQSIKNLPPLYWAEDRPIFIHVWPGFSGHDVIDDASPSLRDGLFVNATAYLSRVRLALADTVSEG